MKVVRTIFLNKWPRATISEHLLTSYRDKVHLTFHLELDVCKVKKLKQKFTQSVKEKFETRLTYTGIFTKLVPFVLRENLDFNSVSEGNEVRVIDDINVNVAVQSEKLGLVTPVIRNVDKKTLGEIALELNTIVEKTRRGNISISDLKGGTFTISNIGMLNSVDSFTQIINGPQTAILGIGRTVNKPVAIDEEIEVRPVCSFNLTFDHRVIDGYHGAEFLALWKTIIENPSVYITSP